MELKKLKHFDEILDKNKNDIKNNDFFGINDTKFWTVIRQVISTLIITIFTTRAIASVIQIIQNKSQFNTVFFENISKFQIRNILKNSFYYEKLKKSVHLSQFISQFQLFIIKVIIYTGDILGDMGIIDIMQKYSKNFKFAIPFYSVAPSLTFLQNQYGIFTQQILILIGIMITPLFIWIRILKSINNSISALGDVILIGYIYIYYLCGYFSLLMP
jgi:hypothetical protein